MEKLKVLFCTDGIFPESIGGMQRHSRLLIEQLAESKQVTLIVIHPHKKEIFQPEPSIKEILIEPIDPHKNYLLECFEYSKQVYKIITEYPDHIIYSQGLSVWYGIKKLKHRQVIVNPHGLEPYQAISWKERLIAVPFKLVFNHIFNHSTVVISLGGLLTTILKNQINNKNTRIVVLPNGVSINRENSIKKFAHDRLQLLFVARFAHNKGIHILLQAVKELNEEGWKDKLLFQLGGMGPLFDLYSKNYNYENVKYLGFISDEQLIDLYRDSDLFVFPTLFEGMPTVVLEAMSFGLPVIVSNVGATAELVDETNGYLIPKNSVVELKKAIVAFYNLQTDKKINLSRASIQKIKKLYNWSIIAKNYINLFVELNSK